VAAALVGAVTAAILLAYNHALTGSYWRSTYALAEPRYFDLSPTSLLQTARSVSRWSLQGTALYIVPFLFLLAAYAVYAETERPHHTYVLAALIAALMIGYTAEPAPSDSVVGERFWYESFFALSILGARGWRSFRTRWRRHATRAVTVAILAVSCFHYAIAIKAVRTRVTPYLRLTDVVAFLEGDIGPDFNQNAADWRHAPVFYMVDPGPPYRG
jgi:hypothetical protein